MQPGTLCHNLLNLTGRRADVSAARAVLAGPHSALEFDRVIPPPAGLNASEREAWCDQHWGTAHGPQLRDVVEERSRGGLIYSFATLAPPVAFCQTLAGLHPGLKVLLVNQHGDDPTGEKRRWESGVITEELTFDVARVVQRFGAALERRRACRARFAASRRRGQPAQLARRRRATRQ